MARLGRRTFLELSAAGIGAAAAATGLPAEAIAAAEASPFKPEKGAQLQLLRWTEFVKGDRTAWEENTKKFTALDRRPGANSVVELAGRLAESRTRRANQFRSRYDHGLEQRRVSVPR